MGGAATLWVVIATGSPTVVSEGQGPPPATLEDAMADTNEIQKTIGLSQDDIDRIMRYAMKKGLGFSPTVRMMLREQLDEIDEIEKANAEPTAAPASL